MLFTQVCLWYLTDALSTKLATARRRAQTGQGLVEYGLILALVAVVVVGLVTLFGKQLGDTFSNIIKYVPGNSTQPCGTPASGSSGC
jgi:pilus assembly protein Flp/PilA